MEEITEQDIVGLMKELSDERCAFWSEADFQYSLAWKLNEKFRCQDVCVKLERRFDSDRKKYVDIWVKLKGAVYLLELKYKTVESTVMDVDGDKISLLEQSAQDLGRYGYVKDISRIEGFIDVENNKAEEGEVHDKIKRGFAIILTNDSAYYKKSSRKNTLDRRFRIHQEHVVNGNLNWLDSMGKTLPSNHWTKNYPPLYLKGIYLMRWRTFGDDSLGFKYCIATIENDRWFMVVP